MPPIGRTPPHRQSGRVSWLTLGLVTSESRLESGPGWYIDRETLLPVIEDVNLFRAFYVDDPVVEILIALWTGRPDEAENQLYEELASSDSPRLRALLADAWRDQGRPDDAIGAYEQLVQEVLGTTHEAVMQQHLGKALFVAGRHEEAAKAFEKALRLRSEAGADESLVRSSRMAAERAHEAARTTT